MSADLAAVSFRTESGVAKGEVGGRRTSTMATSGVCAVELAGYSRHPASAMLTAS
jgi:hypothetical protein